MAEIFRVFDVEKHSVKYNTELIKSKKKENFSKNTPDNSQFSEKKWSLKK